MRTAWRQRRAEGAPRGEGDEYYRINMLFALLEYWSVRTDDEHVLQRESYWKDVLHARTLGHNKN